MWRIGKSSSDEDKKAAEISIDWGREFAIFAATYGWTPQQVAELTLPQFRDYQAFAYEQLSGGRMNQSIPSDAVHQEQADSTNVFEAAAMRIKKQRGIPMDEKTKISLDDVFAEMKNG